MGIERTKDVQSKWFNWFRSGLLALYLVLAASCTTVPQPGPESEQATTLLHRQLTALDDRVDEAEAGQIAESAVRYALELAGQYRTVRPPWLHNYFVNNGLRERGLCYEWANDLFVHLHQLGVRSLELHLIVARMDTSHEHNAISISAHGKPFETGIVIDAWRRSGRLVSLPLAEDKKYPWKLLPPDRINPDIQRLVAKQ